ncbi:hypothetical protein BJY00DRAFT_315457 [Aspergillus carlsbadensis]|nr:hypothetical protein BJY00DRAFT_315457 [Aspergillus carlsbadensis]
MHSTSYHLLTFTLLSLLTTVTAAPHTPRCRYLPGDPQWPSPAQWQVLNRTIGGRLIRGKPLANVCHAVDYDADACASLRDHWADSQLYFRDPVNVMSPYWLNDSCSAFPSMDSACVLGNIASYAINVTGVEDVRAGLDFVRRHNIRLSIKNTGHDFLGRSNGAGSLALWTHNLKDIQVLTNYTSPGYSGPALKMGAGVQVFEAHEAAADHGYRVTGGFCPTVGIVGGYVQGGGHGALQGAYGLAADNTLEFEVVTTDGRHLIASPTENQDLFWALNGGGGGTYAVVLSQTTKAHADGIVAGASLSFSAGMINSTDLNETAYWSAIEAWHGQLLIHDGIPGMSAFFGFTDSRFDLYVASLPDSPASHIEKILAPFLKTLTSLGLKYTHQTTEHTSYHDHFAAYTPGPLPYGSYLTNTTIGGRLIPRDTVHNDLPALISAFRTTTAQPGLRINAVAANITHARVGNTPASNAVLPAWRDALYNINMDVFMDPAAPVRVLEEHQAQMNRNQGLLRVVTAGSASGGGAYLNEATFDNPGWRADYFGRNYPRLLEVKRRYDPAHVLYAHATVGSEDWVVAPDGRLCVAGRV